MICPLYVVGSSFFIINKFFIPLSSFLLCCDHYFIFCYISHLLLTSDIVQCIYIILINSPTKSHVINESHHDLRIRQKIEYNLFKSERDNHIINKKLKSWLPNSSPKVYNVGKWHNEDWALAVKWAGHLLYLVAQSAFG